MKSRFQPILTVPLEVGIYFPSAFNSSPVLPPCLRRRAMISGCLYSMALSKAVLPSSQFAFTSAPFSIKISAISVFPPLGGNKRHQPAPHKVGKPDQTKIRSSSTTITCYFPSLNGAKIFRCGTMP